MECEKVVIYKLKISFYYPFLQDGGLNTSGEAEGEIPQKIFVSTQIYTQIHQYTNENTQIDKPQFNSEEEST